MRRDLELDLLRLLAREGGCSRAYCVSALGAHGGAVSQALGRQRRAGHVEAVSVERGGDRWTAHQLTDAGRAWLASLTTSARMRAALDRGRSESTERPPASPSPRPGLLPGGDRPRVEEYAWSRRPTITGLPGGRR